MKRGKSRCHLLDCSQREGVGSPAMSSLCIREQSMAYMRKIPDIRPGMTLRVYERIHEGEKERVQSFEGLVISMHKGSTPADSMFTLRSIVGRVGVERVFPLHSPNLVKIEVRKVAKVRRAKLTFLRGRHGKGARLSDRFTTAEEFNVAVASEGTGAPVAEGDDSDTSETEENN